jgi:hypothetical protein
MPGELDALPGREIRENLPARFRDLFLDQPDLFIKAHIQRVRLAMLLQLIQLGLQLDDGLLEIKLMFHGGGKVLSRRRLRQR